MIRQIQYENAAHGLRFEFPADWDVGSVTGVTCAVYGHDGTAILAADAATLYTATSLDEAVAVGDASITLSAGAAAVKKGDRLCIVASSAGPAEIVEVESYATSTRVVALRHACQYAHSDTTAVKGAWATYDLDASDTGDYYSGRDLVIVWQVAGIDAPQVTWSAQVAKQALALDGLLERFRAVYGTLYETETRDFEVILDEATRRVSLDMRARNLDLDRVIEQDILHPAIMERVRLLIACDGGDQYQTERDDALRQYAHEIETLSALPIWQDENQDKTIDEGERERYVAVISHGV